MPLPKPRPITLRGAQPGEARTVELYQADFAALRQINEGKMIIKNAERQYRRLMSRGLATHKFETDGSGFPRAVAVLTPDGLQALAQAVG